MAPTVAGSDTKNVFYPSYTDQDVSPIVLGKNSISTNWEAGSSSGFLDQSRPSHHGKSCKTGRFGAGEI